MDVRKVWRSQQPVLCVEYTVTNPMKQSQKPSKAPASLLRLIDFSISPAFILYFILGRN